MSTIDDTHDSGIKSWIASANLEGADFPIQNLPLGVFRRRGTAERPRIGVAIGDQILDLVQAREAGLLRGLPSELIEAVSAPTLNGLMALGRQSSVVLRRRLVDVLRANGPAAEPQVLAPINEADLLLPAVIGDYTDFYASIHHATRVGRLFRPDHQLQLNYKHVPIVYHGRASSIVPGGTPIQRPSGQVAGPDGTPTFQPSARLDYELELGLFVGPGNALGHPLTIDDAEAQIFGFCLVNDWSARDIQAWEAQPLGPFLAKNFATSISPWMITSEALAPFRCSPAAREPGDPRPLRYLQSESNDAAGAFDVHVEALLRSAAMRRAAMAPVRLSAALFRDMYWTPAQMLAHHASNGCNLRPGDLLASGTISGPHQGSEGCLLEMTRGGTEPVTLPTGEARAFLVDGDEVILRAYCERSGYRRIGFGECAGIILAAARDERRSR